MTKTTIYAHTIFYDTLWYSPWATCWMFDDWISFTNHLSIVLTFTPRTSACFTASCLVKQFVNHIPRFRVNPCSSVVGNISPFISLDSLNLSPQAKEVFNYVCDCKITTQIAFSPNVACIMGYKALQVSIAQQITRCNSALKIGYKCLSFPPLVLFSQLAQRVNILLFFFRL